MDRVAQTWKAIVLSFKGGRGRKIKYSSALIQTLIRLGAATLVVSVVLGSRNAAAVGTEKPYIISAYPNAPGMITLEWVHSGKGVYGWAVELQSQSSPPWLPPRDVRIYSITGLEPNRTYSFHVCAVYDFNRVCSDEGGVGYTNVTTQPPPPPRTPPPPPPPPPPSSPTAQPLPTPVIKAELFWPVLYGPTMVRLKWANPVDATQFALLRYITWYKNGAYMNNTTTPEVEDVLKPKENSSYRLCVENTVSKSCSNEVGVAAPEPKPADRLYPPDSKPAKKFPKP
jgi:hypothetical protein